MDTCLKARQLAISYVWLYFNSVSFTPHFIIIQIAHPQVQSKLLDLIYHGFLVSVMASSLGQVGNVQISGSVNFIFGNPKMKKKILAGQFCFSLLIFFSGNIFKKAMEHGNKQ